MEKTADDDVGFAQIKMPSNWPTLAPRPTARTLKLCSYGAQVQCPTSIISSQTYRYIVDVRLAFLVLL